jgi:proteic killer suppression protein
LINTTADLHALNQPGFQLTGSKPVRYSITITGAWRVTSEWDQTDPYRVDFKQDH